MFRLHKSLDIITLFHAPTSPASTRALNLLKQASAAASSTATEDQASDHSAQNQQQRGQQGERAEFELNVTEEPPTPDQLRTIVEYMGVRKVGDLVEGAKSDGGIAGAVRRLNEGGKFKRPVIVDWNNGRAVIGDNESEILKLVGGFPKGNDS